MFAAGAYNSARDPGPVERYDYFTHKAAEADNRHVSLGADPWLSPLRYIDLDTELIFETSTFPVARPPLSGDRLK